MFLYRKAALKEAMSILGIKKLRNQQDEILKRIYSCRDVFVMMPTGGGKSLLYQLPALCEYEGLTLVISPLKALQLDQVLALEKKGIAATAINSDMVKKEREEILNNLGAFRLVYLAPEQLRCKDVQEALSGVLINRIVVDESHVLSQAELDFRPAYGEIGGFIHDLGYHPQIMAMTATATKVERKHIIESLGMQDAKKYIFPIRRENLKLNVKQIAPVKGEGTKRERLESSFMRAVEGALKNDWNGKGRVIVYAPFKRRAKAIRKWLKGCGFKHLGLYTGDTKKKKRRKLLRKFKSGKIRVMVATSAFGLGIDVPNVRLIIHAGLPLSMDSYVQECGRAGRDGKYARCILLYASTDFENNKDFLKKSLSQESIPQALFRLDALHEITRAKQCLWKSIENYFGVKSGERCKHCCFCRMKDTAW